MDKQTRTKQAERLAEQARDLLAHAPLRSVERSALSEAAQGVALADRSQPIRSTVEINAARMASAANACEQLADDRKLLALVEASNDREGIARATGVEPLTSAIAKSKAYASTDRAFAIVELPADHNPLIGLGPIKVKSGAQSIGGSAGSKAQPIEAKRRRLAARQSQTRLARIASAQRKIAIADRLDLDSVWRAPRFDATVTGQAQPTIGYGPADPTYHGSETYTDPTYTCGRPRQPVIETPELLAREGWTGDRHTPIGGYGRKIKISSLQANESFELIKGEKVIKPAKPRKRGKRGKKRR